MPLINTDINTIMERVINYLQENIKYQGSSMAVATGSTAGRRITQKVQVTADFPDVFIDQSGNYIRRSHLPTIAVSIQQGYAENTGVGTVVGTDVNGNTVRGIYTTFYLETDIWSISPEQRDIVASEILRLMWENRLTVARGLGVLEIKLSELGERGFDLTDRILQYQSHQIAKVWRRLLSFKINTEVYKVIDEENSDYYYEQIHLSVGDETSYMGNYLSELFEEYLKDIWIETNMGLL